MKPRQWALMEQEGGGEGEAGAGGGGGGGEGDQGLGTIEERATRMGWAPKEQFRGDPAKWVDAQTFVKNGEESLPILRDRLRKLERDAAENARVNADFRKYHEQTEERAYERAKKELEAKIRAEVKAGNENGATQAAQDLAELEGQHATNKAATKADPEWDSWIADNRWYQDDAELREEAEVEAFRLRKRMAAKAEPVLEGAAFLNKVKESLKARLPHKFGGNPRRQQASGVERSDGGGGDASRGGKKGWNELPAEAKTAGEKFIKQGLIKDKATYAAEYWLQSEIAA